MSKSSEYVKAWRKNTKQKIVTSMGGCCQICSYNKCNDALELHHLNPNEKDFGVSAFMRHPVKWESIVTEIKKCILLCSNCHKEVHKGISIVPNIYQKYDEALILVKETVTFCPVCNKQKETRNKYCSLSCAASTQGKINWNSVDLIDLIENQKLSKTKIANMMNCSDQAVNKRYKKLKAL